MRLPEQDESYLKGKGYKWHLLPDGKGGCLIIPGFDLAPELFTLDETDLMIRIPPGYNMAGLDMFYVDPEIKLTSSGAYPVKADVFETHCGRRWQRFSRHLTTTPWRPGIDGLAMYMRLIQSELRPNGKKPE